MKGKASWNPVFVDVIDRYGIKQGHLTSDGYGHRRWSFFPSDSSRRIVKLKSFEAAVPKWVGQYSLVRTRSLDGWDECSKICPECDLPFDPIPKNRRYCTACRPPASAAPVRRTNGDAPQPDTDQLVRDRIEDIMQRLQAHVDALQLLLDEL